jgi:F-type H+-transporting ATPase subunit alpha
MRWSIRLALLALSVAAIGVIMPGTPGAAPPAANASIPDQWSGEWPAQLMETTGLTPLGTLVWREIRYEDGMGLVGKDYGGRLFTGCPTDGKTRFFRGRYVQGGSLIGCTRGDDGTELVGRFDGNETFRSSGFTIRITGRNPSFFVGEYVEDDGITVDWCGTRTRIIDLPDTPSGSVDYTAPRVSIRSAKATVGGLARLRFSVRDASPTVRVDLSVIAGDKAVANLSLPAARADGRLTTKTWRVPRAVRGKKLRVCVAALDRSGNVSGRVDVKLRPEEITSILKQRIEQYDVETDLSEVGTVLQVGDGIARVYGLENCVSLERLEFEHGVVGIAFNLEEDNVGVALFGEWQHVKEGEPVRRTGEVMSVPVGQGFLGRVVDPLGTPLDGQGPVEADGMRPLEFKAPGVVQRQPVKEPLQTGLKAIDSMIPIGRGQRELIIGDRGTGKTAVAVDTIINQRGGDVICIYVAVGQKASTVAQVYEKLRDVGAMEYTIIVSAPAQEAAPIKWMAPFAGAAMGEHFLYDGKHALVIYDDLTKHADSYRQLSLLLRRPPGREAFPGDVFYLHSRLLERACKLSDQLGGGSLTALPVIETQAGDVSAYIPTNVDGQIFLESDLFFSGVRPAINVGISVSRVGGNAQTKAMKKVAGRLRLDLAQYRELEAFAQFGSELDAATQQALSRGERMVATLNQPQYQPWPVEEQVVAIYAGIHGWLDRVPVPQVPRFQEELRETLRADGGVYEAIRQSGDLSDDATATLDAALQKFVDGFAVQEEKGLA